MKKHSHLKTKYILAFMSRCPLAVLLIASIGIFTVIGACYTMAHGKMPEMAEKKPLFASLFLGEANEEELGEANPYEFETEEEIDIPELTTEETVTDENGNVKKVEETTYVTEFVKKDKVKEDSPYYDDPGLVALTTDYPYSEVKKSYFDDALFIGDSRIEGMKLYSSLSNATYWSKEGTTIYKILSEKIVEKKIDGKQKKISVQRALKDSSFSKIYIMLGINELGYKTTEDFAEKYNEVVDKVHRLQPKATIYLLAIMKVSAEKNKDEVYNNENINAKNVAIAKIAANDGGKTIFYLDVNENVLDKKGNLKEKYTWDGIHLQSQYYELVVDFLKKHAVVKDASKEETTKEPEITTKQEETTTKAPETTSEETTTKKKNEEKTTEKTTEKETTKKNKEETTKKSGSSKKNNKDSDKEAETVILGGDT